MLPTTRNSETLSILKRLRNQGAPNGKKKLGTNLGSIMGEGEEEDLAGDADASSNEMDPSGSIIDARRPSDALLSSSGDDETDEDPASRLQQLLKKKRLKSRGNSEES